MGRAIAVERVGAIPLLVTSSSATHFAADALKVRNAPPRGPWPACATLAIGLLRRRGHRTLAAALRGTTRVLPLQAITSPGTSHAAPFRGRCVAGGSSRVLLMNW
jgi:hypothetical protein